jgi:hypothetical protein
MVPPETQGWQAPRRVEGRFSDGAGEGLSSSDVIPRLVRGIQGRIHKPLVGLTLGRPDEPGDDEGNVVKRLKESHDRP